MNTKAIDQAIEVLNRALAADPEAIASLLACRVPCNNTLAADPTIQVNGDDMSIGALGLINGLFGVQTDGWGYITARYTVVCKQCDDLRDGVVGDKCLVCGEALQLGNLLGFERVRR